jgi:hypothetical protein
MAKTKKAAAHESAPSGEALPEASTSPETRSPAEWSREFFPPSDRGSLNKHLYRHGAAEALHGWTLHEHHAGAPIQLTREDYVAAIKAATTPANTFAPHPAALSPFHPGRS